MSLTPDQLTKRDFHDRGYRIVKVEHYLYIPGQTVQKRRDLLGIYDFIAMGKDDTIAVQTTSKTNFSSRRNKMLSSQSFTWWTSEKAKRRSILQGWYKENGKWRAKEEELTMQKWHTYQKELREKDSELEQMSRDELAQQLFS